MRKTSFAEIAQTVQELLDQQQYQEVALLLGQVRLSPEDREEWTAVREMLRQVPVEHRLRNAAILYAKALRLSWDFQAVLEWSTYVEASQTKEKSIGVKLESLAALNALREYQQAVDLAEAIIPSLFGEELGLAWARLGRARFPLNLDWQTAFETARTLLNGEELGRTLLNYGYCLSMSGQITDAHRTWLEALTYFKQNPYFSAWLRYNLALIALNDLEPEAERHLLEALKHVQHPKAESFQSAIWNNLGRFRGQLGEWKRAEFAFAAALKSKPDIHDKLVAYRGLIRTHYLAGRLGEALENLEIALHEPDLDPQMLLITQAKVYLKLGQPVHAKAALERAGEPQHELELWPWRVAQAELARAQGRPEEALRLLEGLPLHTLHSREEVRQWPRLFELLRQAGRAVPEPLEYMGQLMVEVRALGALQVSVNGRAVPLAPTGRAGELLVLLLENNRQASSERLVELLWPGSLATRKRQALWLLVNELRHALGWAGSVGSLRKAYRLDPTVEWRYDVEAAKAQGKLRGSFLEGVYSDWALEVDQELEQYRL